MKVFISSDIEGVAGVTALEHLMPDGFGWQEARELMSREVAAAADVALASGAETVIVADGHGNAMSLLPELMPTGVELVRGWPRPLLQMQGIDQPGIAAALFLGYHASAQHPLGHLAHTFKGSEIAEIRLNGVAASEAYVNAAIAGEFGVPVILGSGSDAFIEEFRAFNPEAVMVSVKRDEGFLSQTSIAPAVARTRIADGVRIAMDRLGAVPPLVLPPPFTVDIVFRRRLPAEVFAYLPVLRRSGAFSITYSAGTMAEVARLISFILFCMPSGRIG